MYLAWLNVLEVYVGSEWDTVCQWNTVKLGMIVYLHELQKAAKESGSRADQAEAARARAEAEAAALRQELEQRDARLERAEATAKELGARVEAGRPVPGGGGLLCAILSYSRRVMTTEVTVSYWYHTNPIFSLSFPIFLVLSVPLSYFKHPRVLFESIRPQTTQWMV